MRPTRIWNFMQKNEMAKWHEFDKLNNRMAASESEGDQAWERRKNMYRTWFP